MKIILVKTSSLGDILQTLPVVSFLKNRYPKAQVDWVVERPFKEILEAHPDVHSVIPIEMRKWKKNIIRHRGSIRLAIQALRHEQYDILFDLQGNIKSALITRCIRSKEKVGTTLTSAPEWPNALALTHRYPLNPKDPISLQYLFLVHQHFSDNAPTSCKKFKRFLGKTQTSDSNKSCWDQLAEFCSFQPPLTFKMTPKESLWLFSKLKKGHRTMICTGSFGKIRNFFFQLGSKF